MSEKKEFPGGFYGTGQKKEVADDCDNCMYDNKKVQKDVEECPSCLYIPGKGDKDLQKDVKNNKE
ncbi:MAG: hypothetical protein ACK5LT_10330 [Lachnospirales bacterium]